MAQAKIPDIGKYRIIELVGEGAMGVVYRAVDSVLNRTVAIKVMNDAIARQQDLRQRFLHEAQAAASLQHPNVVSIYDLGEADGHLFIAMEYVEGLDLEHLIDSKEPLSLHVKLDIVIDVLTGLSFAHKHGIVHRDIKPANIRVADDGRAKIMDFGVAHLASSNLTSTGTSLGTPGYMAPEQITGGKTTAGTDIFAVGGVLYELLTGVKPFDGATLQNLFFKIITEQPPSVHELKPGLPPALDRIVMKALAKDPDERFANALDMANELSSVRGKLSGPSHPSSVSLSATVAQAMAHSHQTARLKRRNFALAGAGVLVLIVVALVTRFQLPNSRPQPPLADDEQHAPTVSSGESAPPATPAPVREVPRAANPTPVTAPGQRIAKTPNPTTSIQQSAQSAAVSAPPTANTQTGAAPPPLRADVETARPPAAAASTLPPAPESAPAATTAADLAPTFEAYARAIESRDIPAIRRVYPGLTLEQERGFEQFFQSARKINVTFRVANVEGAGSSADARLMGNYEYENSSGKLERTPVSFAATLRRDGNGWRLVSLR